MSACLTNGLHTPGSEWEIECPVHDAVSPAALHVVPHGAAQPRLARVGTIGSTVGTMRVVAPASPLPKRAWQSEAKYREYVARWDAERAGSHYLMGGVGAVASPDAQEAPGVTKPGDQGGSTGSPFPCIVTDRSERVLKAGLRNGRTPLVTRLATPNGRPPQHGSAADRQRAYRGRIKAAMLAGNDALAAHQPEVA